MAVPSYFTTGEKIAHYGLRVFVGVVLLFLIAPILAVMPLTPQPPARHPSATAVTGR